MRFLVLYIYPCLCIFPIFLFIMCFILVFFSYSMFFFNLFQFACFFKTDIYIYIYIKFVCCFFLLMKTWKLLFSNACLYLWIKLCGTTKDEFVINIIHLHILATTIVHISRFYKGDQRICNLLPSSWHY
jgi:hypothetical protein